MKTLILFEWDTDRAEKRAAMIRKGGWNVVVESEDGKRGVGHALNITPDLLVFDLARKPWLSRAAAESIREYRALKGIPMMFVDGELEDQSKTGERIRRALFLSSEQLLKRLAQFDG